MNSDHAFLFAKSLSNQSINVYKDLCNLAGKVFEAVPTDEHRTLSSNFPFVDDSRISIASSRTNSLQSANTASSGSFTSRIHELEVQNQYLAQQASLLKTQLDSEVKLRLEVKEKLDLSYERLQTIVEDLQKANRRASYFEKSALKYSQGVAELFPIITDLQGSGTFTSDGFL